MSEVRGIRCAPLSGTVPSGLARGWHRARVAEHAQAAKGRLRGAQTYRTRLRRGVSTSGGFLWPGGTVRPFCAEVEISRSDVLPLPKRVSLTKPTHDRAVAPRVYVPRVCGRAGACGGGGRGGGR